MEQRPLRLGDIVDDYCPRERRLTNHAIVAIVEQTIRQTRCTTCDAEHVYKGAKTARRKKKDDAGGDLAGGQLVVPRAASPDPAAAEMAEPPASPMPPISEPVIHVVDVVEIAAAAVEIDTATEPQNETQGDYWPAHRQLIRATLPKVDGEVPPARPIPEFTMHQRQGRGGQGHGYRQGSSWHGGNGHSRNGFRSERDGNVAPGQGQGPGGGRGRHRRNRRGR